MTTNDVPELRCHDACGAVVADEDAATAAGWSYLHALQSWRCGACARALYEASVIKGTEPVPFTDTLPPSSIGALKRETASTIQPPVVKGDPND